MIHPTIIQGGMGVAISGWRLARAVSQREQMGVVSGTALAAMITRRLQLGDQGGHLARAAQAFPDQAVVDRVWQTYFREGGIGPHEPYKLHSIYTLKPAQDLLELTVLACFCEVWLAKEGHNGVVGFNLLEKLQLTTLPSLYGAMLAGVDYVIMGAGIPLEIPGALDRLAQHMPATLRIDVTGAEKGDDFHTVFDPLAVLAGPIPPLNRPFFFPIISSNVLALALRKRATGRIDGFVVEAPTAGGHNAPPRGVIELNEAGEPLYGERDLVDLAKLRDLGLPFWLAGSCGTPKALTQALASGAQGIQVGTAFAFCSESGMAPEIKATAISQLLSGTLKVYTDPKASPTGFPFKVVLLADTMGDPNTYAARERLCDLGYLRRAYKKDNGAIGFRCPAEPAELYVKKGGANDDIHGRKCLCNGLAAAAGLGQRINGHYEPPLVTAGDAIDAVIPLIERHGAEYSAEDVVDYLLQTVSAVND
jgi:nitronate monooxygenase